MRYEAVRRRCQDFSPILPSAPHPAGVVARAADGRRLGIWIMPDNRSRGMLETFLALLVPTSTLLDHARAAHGEAIRLGAPCRPPHADKALVHTWLAWQDPPGRQLHEAVRDRVLDTASPHADAFVAWFRDVFEV